MTRLPTIPPAPTHAKHVRICKRDLHGRFLPVHGHCFPERLQNGRGHNQPVPERMDFPSTGTPASVVHTDDTAVKNDWIEPEQDDWLDGDVFR